MNKIIIKAKNNRRKLAIAGTGLIMGTLFSIQAKSFSDFNNVYERESKVNIFREIQVLKDSNKLINDEIKELEVQIANGTNKEEAFKTIAAEIDKNKLLAGEVKAKGPGVKIVADGDINAIWFTDIINELYSAGAEMVAVNGVQFSESSYGFDTLPNGQILFGGNILTKPYTFEAIGDSKTIYDALNQSGGILQRINENIPSLKISAERADTIIIEPIPTE